MTADDLKQKIEMARDAVARELGRRSDEAVVALADQLAAARAALRDVAAASARAHSECNEFVESQRLHGRFILRGIRAELEHHAGALRAAGNVGR